MYDFGEVSRLGMRVQDYAAHMRRRESGGGSAAEALAAAPIGPLLCGKADKLTAPTLRAALREQDARIQLNAHTHVPCGTVGVCNSYWRAGEASLSVANVLWFRALQGRLTSRKIESGLYTKFQNQGFLQDPFGSM